MITAIVTATAAGLMAVLSSLPEAGHRDDAVGEARTSQTASESSLAWHQPASRPGLDLPIETVGPLPPDGTVRAANGLDIDAPIETTALLAPVETDARRPALAPTEGPPDVIGVLAPLLRAQIENAPQLQSPVHPAIAEVTARSAGDLAGAALAPTAVVGDGAAAPRSAHLRPSWSHPRHTPRIAGRSGRGAAGAVASRVASIRQQALTLPAILRPTPF